MKYRDLIQFEQIDSVIQLLDAERPKEAKKLVSTYEISDDLASRICNLVIPQIGFDDSVDHKGVLIVGNYGTGKSHLMSVLSLVAEDAAYAPMIRHTKVADAVAPIAGRFGQAWWQLYLPDGRPGAQQQKLLRGDDDRLRRGVPGSGRAAGRRRIPGISAVPPRP